MSDLAAKIKRWKLQPRALPAEFHDDVLRLQRAVGAVLDLHQPHEWEDPFSGNWSACGPCGQEPPCSTVRALAGALGVLEDKEI